jgi:thiamine-monophosphate kinase
MGGEPVAVFLSLALPAKLPQKWMDQFMKGLLKLAAPFHVTLAGGDTAKSPAGVLADIVVVGSVPRGRAVLRSTAKVGDRIYVTGMLGGAAAELEMLYSKRKHAQKPSRPSSHVFLFPAPRIEVGRILRDRRIATSMIDLSDGLSTDLSHICEESGVGAQVSAEAVPRAKTGGRGLVDLQAVDRQFVDLELALHGGEDYELLFTASPAKRVPHRIAGVQITEIGRITRSRRILLIEPEAKRELEPKGWQHFAGSGE